MYIDDSRHAYRKRVEDDRKFWKYIVFGILTFGIYRIYWEYCINEDINTICDPKEDDPSDRTMNYLLVMLLSIITFSVYFWIWIYKEGDRVNRAGKRYGVEIQESGSTYLIWGLLGAAIGYIPLLIWTFSGMNRFSIYNISDIYRITTYYTSMSVFNLLGSIGPYIMWYILCRNVNKIARAYNYIYVYGDSPSPSPSPNPNPDPAPAPAPAPGPIRQGTVYTPIGRDGPVTGLLTANGELYFTRGEYKGQVISLSPTYRIVLGRNVQTSQLIFHNPNVSRTHCLIEFIPQENSFYVTDYSSRGTWMNGSMRLKSNIRQKCPPGTSITLTDDGVNEFMLR